MSVGGMGLTSQTCRSFCGGLRPRFEGAGSASAADGVCGWKLRRDLQDGIYLEEKYDAVFFF